MQRRLAFCTTILIMLATAGAALAESFYIRDGSNISKVERGRPEEVQNVMYWQYRLYKKGAPTGGNDQWGSISDRSPEAIRTYLEKCQRIEMENEKHYPSTSKETFFNPLGPIAVVDSLTSKNRRQSLLLLYDAWGNANKFLTKYRMLNTLLVREKGYNNPFRGVGTVLSEYAANFIDVHKKQDNLLEQFEKHGADLAAFSADMSEFERNLDSYQRVQAQVGSWLNNPDNSYASGISVNDRKAGYAGAAKESAKERGSQGSESRKGKSKKCSDWRDGTFKVSAGGSDKMFLDTYIYAYVCKKFDDPASYGQNLCLENKSSTCKADYSTSNGSGTLMPKEKKIIPIPFDNGPGKINVTKYQVNLHYAKDP